MRSIRNKTLMIYFILFIIYQELIFGITSFKNINIYTFLFSIVIGSLLYLFIDLFRGKYKHIITYFIIVLITFLFISNYIYYSIYKSIISIYSIINGGQVLEFSSQILSTVLDNIGFVILIFFPVIIFIFLDVKKMIGFRNNSIKKNIILFLSLILFHFGIVLSTYITNSKELYSDKNLYFNINAPLLITNRFGLLTEFRLDIVRSIFGFKEKDLEEEIVVPKEEIDEKIEYNKLEINFDKLVSNDNEEIKKIDEYINNQMPTNKNDYTGYFKDKNLIVFVAEAFSDMAIDKELTPTLYKLYNEGFQFTNFYSPLFPVSTADGEYITDTSLIPKEGLWSLYDVRGNYMPYSYANVFEKLGYKSNAYHNNTATYYHRNDYIKTMGYDSFKACGAGLNINCKIWPQSDYEMITASTDDYINEDNFISYYMTVSGHLEYTRYGNMMVSRNFSRVKDLSYSEKAKGYLAANIELDKAIEELIKRLEEKGKLSDTVIAISPDHYPYGLSIDEINEISTYERDEEFEIHHSAFLLWNSEMKKNIKVDKYISNLDVLPTILNLFGVEYDSRLLMGKDIFSDSDPLVIFSDRSFITDKGKYNSVTKEFTSFNEEVDKEYIDQIKSIIYSKYKYSRMILEEDYYKSLFDRIDNSNKS